MTSVAAAVIARRVGRAIVSPSGVPRRWQCATIAPPSVPVRTARGIERAVEVAADDVVHVAAHSGRPTSRRGGRSESGRRVERCPGKSHRREYEPRRTAPNGDEVGEAAQKNSVRPSPGWTTGMANTPPRGGRSVATRAPLGVAIRSIRGVPPSCQRKYEKTTERRRAPGFCGGRSIVRRVPQARERSRLDAERVAAPAERHRDLPVAARATTRPRERAGADRALWGGDVICSEPSMTLTFSAERGAHGCRDLWQCSCARSS